MKEEGVATFGECYHPPHTKNWGGSLHRPVQQLVALLWIINSQCEEPAAIDWCIS